MKIFDVKAAKDLGIQFSKNDHKMVGQDGAYSIPVGNETLWFFGDTLIGNRDPQQSLWYLDGKAVGAADMSGKGLIDKMINNTGLLLGSVDARKGLQDFRYILDEKGGLKNLIPLLPDEDVDEIRMWCQHGIAFGKTVYLSFIKVRMLEKPNGMLPVMFEIIGSGWAKGSTDDWEFTRIFADGTDIWWAKKEPHFASAIIQKDDFLYCYGTRQDEDVVQRSYLARVDKDKIEDKSAYRYLSSAEPTWSENVEDAIPLFTGLPNELSISFNEYLGCYLAVHSMELSGVTVGRTAPNPWGPWSEPVDLWKVGTKHERPVPYPKLIYAGKEHPKLARENGRIIYITYIEFEEYYPHLIEVTLDKLK